MKKGIRRLFNFIQTASLTSRLLAGFTLIAGIGFGLMMDRVLDRVERQYLEASEEGMVDMVHLLAEMLEEHLTDDGSLDTAFLDQAVKRAKSREISAQVYSFLKTQIDLDVYVTDLHGRVMFDSMFPNEVGQVRNMRDVWMTLRGMYGARSSRFDEADKNSSMMFVGAPLFHRGEMVGVVSLGKPQKSIFKFRDETSEWLKRTIGTLVLCMVLGSFLLARWTTRPIRRLTEYAKSIARGEKPPLPQLHGSEMKTLGGAFESMRDVLENRESLERYVQTLTHELKSPIAAIQGASELLQEGKMNPAQQEKFLKNIHLESLRVQELLDRLLKLAGLEKQKFLESSSEVDLTALVRELAERFMSMSLARKVEIVVDVKSEARVQGDPFLIQTAMTNLVQNAIEFSPQDGKVKLILEQADERVYFTVEDEGPGIPEFASDRIYDRFYSLPRPDTGKKSSGLGLCFVKEVVALHGGSLSITSRESGGTRAELIL